MNPYNATENGFKAVIYLNRFHWKMSKSELQVIFYVELYVFSDQSLTWCIFDPCK